MPSSESDGFLRWVSDDDDTSTDRNFEAFRWIVALGVFAESWLLLRFTPYQAQLGLHIALGCVYGACLIATSRVRFARIASGLMFVGLATQVALAFPDNANHQYLLLCCLLLLILPTSKSDRDRLAERRWAIAGIRWILVIGLFWAGLQKLLHGYYFGGEFLAHRTAFDPNFQSVFRHLMPEAEFERLIGLGRARGAGPFRVETWLFVAVSNASWLLELVIPILLVLRRTRCVGVVLAAVFLVAIEMGARELYFGVLMLAMVLLYWPKGRLARFVPGFALAYAGLFATNLAVLLGRATQ